MCSVSCDIRLTALLFCLSSQFSLIVVLLLAMAALICCGGTFSLLSQRFSLARCSTLVCFPLRLVVFLSGHLTSSLMLHSFAFRPSPCCSLFIVCMRYDAIKLLYSRWHHLLFAIVAWVSTLCALLICGLLHAVHCSGRSLMVLIYSPSLYAA